MKLNALKLGLAMGILGAVYMLLLSLYPWFSETVFGVVKGDTLVAMMQNLYPWYVNTTFVGVLIGMVFCFIDGFIFAFLFGWLYNRLLGK